MGLDPSPVTQEACGVQWAEIDAALAVGDQLDQGAADSRHRHERRPTIADQAHEPVVAVERADDRTVIDGTHKSPGPPAATHRVAHDQITAGELRMAVVHVRLVDRLVCVSGIVHDASDPAPGADHSRIPEDRSKPDTADVVVRERSEGRKSGSSGQRKIATRDVEGTIGRSIPSGHRRR